MTVMHHRYVSAKEWPCRHFSPAEIACRGSGLVMLTPDSIRALKMLDDLRERMGHPLYVNSGYRSPAHNKAVGGAKASKHMEGIAFDISMANVDPQKFERVAREVGFTGIGLYPPQKPSGGKNFIHVDARTGASWRGAQWGEFPKRATRFAEEPAPQPVKDALRDVGPVAAGGAAVEAVLQAAEPGLREAAPWLPPNMQGYAVLAAVLIGFALVAYRVWNSRQRGE